MSTPIQTLHSFGQSLWYDNIERRLLKNGEMEGMIARGEIRGVTSNPSIFHNAIAKTHDYDAALPTMARAGWNAEQIYEQLALEDIRAACDLFLPLYRDTQGGDGYVSLEVSPRLAHDTARTLADARRLWAAVYRPNLMIKIPATLEGLPAVRQAIAAGLNVNVTLIFSLERYRQVMEAYLAGLEDRSAAGQIINQVASVASFFISRIDSKIDKTIGAVDQGSGASLPTPTRPGYPYGKLAIANAKLAYQEFQKTFQTDRFAHLKAQGARLQRPLWASTSTKNPAYPDTLYVDALIGANTVNTVPPQTLVAFGDHGKAELTIETYLDEAQGAFDELKALGISMEGATQELEDEGVLAFADAFEAMLKTIDERRQAAVSS